MASRSDVVSVDALWDVFDDARSFAWKYHENSTACPKTSRTSSRQWESSRGISCGSGQEVRKMEKQNELKSCPFCGGKAKVSFKDYLFFGQNYKGDKKIRYRVQVICNKCRSRGRPIITETLLNPHPFFSKWGNMYNPDFTHCREQTELFEPYVNKAIEAWNRRAGDKE